MQHLLDTWGKTAGSISAILALAGILFFKPFKRWLDRKKKHKAALEDIRRRQEAEEKEADEAFKKAVMTRLTKIDDATQIIISDVGDLQYESLSRAHDVYMEQKWCPDSAKERLCAMHASYRAKGRNHLSQTYEEDILELPNHPSRAN